MKDEDVRASCFGQLAILSAEFGEEIPYRGGLDRGFVFRGNRVPYLSPQKGIFRAAVQRGPAALSVQTSYKSPYDDEGPTRAFSTRTELGPPISLTIAAFELRSSSRRRSSTSSELGRAGTSRTSLAT